MALVKLVCQGCGANLDADDNQTTIQCGYCGTVNRLQQPAPPPPRPQPIQAPQTPYQPQPLPLAAHTKAPPKSGGGSSKAVLIIVLVAVLLPVGLGGFITFMVFRTVSKTVDKTLDTISDASGRTINLGGGNLGLPEFMWVSQRPFFEDIDGDGNEDIVALLQPLGASMLELTVLSGSDYAKRWSVSLGDRSDLPQTILAISPDHDLALVTMGAALRAYALSDGSQRWVANLPDKVEVLAANGDGLVVTSADESVSLVAPGSGAVSELDAKAADKAKPLRTDKGYELIPRHRELDLKRQHFDKLTLERAFCPAEKMTIKDHRRATCSHEHGLAFATRAKGTRVPFIVGYDPSTKAKPELWRVQLTEAGSLETVGSGFEQPRAEFVEGDAIVSFARDKEEGPRVRRVDLATGETKWETKIGAEHIPHLNGMVIGTKVVAVSVGQSMHMLSLADGSVQAKLGRF